MKTTTNKRGRAKKVEQPVRPEGPESVAGSASAPSVIGSHPAAPAGSKQALIIALLSRAEGATLDQLIAATGWLPHTTRAALTGLRKKGCAIERAKGEDGKSLYRIGSTNDDQPPAQAEAASDLHDRSTGKRCMRMTSRSSAGK